MNDAYATHGRIRADGRMVQALRLVEVMSPAESKGPCEAGWHHSGGPGLPAAEREPLPGGEVALSRVMNALIWINADNRTNSDPGTLRDTPWRDC